MEILNLSDQIYWETIHPALRQLMGSIARTPVSSRFYLADGTALALQMGHRPSIDLDFFSEQDEVNIITRRELAASFTPLQAEILESGEGYLVFLAQNIHVGFFSYHYPLLRPCTQAEGIALASPIDIGLMKIDALISRGSRKDFYDLYELSKHISLDSLVELSSAKYTGFRDFPLMAVESMALFDHADRDLQPLLYVETPWEEVKKFFIMQSKALAEKWF